MEKIMYQQQEYSDKTKFSCCTDDDFPLISKKNRYNVLQIVSSMRQGRLNEEKAKTVLFTLLRNETNSKKEKSKTTCDRRCLSPIQRRNAVRRNVYDEQGELVNSVTAIDDILKQFCLI